jgi:hypothetical protein
MSITYEEAKLGRAVYIYHQGMWAHSPGIIISNVYIGGPASLPMVDIRYSGTYGSKYLTNLMLCYAGVRPYAPR